MGPRPFCHIEKLKNSSRLSAEPGFQRKASFRTKKSKQHSLQDSRPGSFVDQENLAKLTSRLPARIPTEPRIPSTTHALPTPRHSLLNQGTQAKLISDGCYATPSAPRNRSQVATHDEGRLMRYHTLCTQKRIPSSHQR